jgi:hypothetical protein
MLSDKFNTEQTELETKRLEFSGVLTENREHTQNAESFVDLLCKQAEITELTAPLLHTLIDKICVFEAEVVDGEKMQRIEIYYKFVGRV